MFKRNLWKIVVSLVLTGWAVSEILPLRDIPFPAYARTNATARPAEFGALLAKAAELKKSGAAPSEFMALKQIGHDQKVDLSQFFPDIRLEESLKNVDKRNTILLNELLRRSKRKMQLGLDLQGGVGFTLEADLGDRTAGLDAESARQQKLSKAIEIISARIHSFGVAEPLLRAAGPTPPGSPGRRDGGGARGALPPAEALEGDRDHQRAHNLIRGGRAPDPRGRHQ